MVNYCRVSGCTNRTDREKHLEYYRLPKVIKNQGEECQRLSEERRRLWLAKLNQDLRGKNLDNIRICSAHFLSGKKSDLYQKDDPDWVPSVGLTGQQGGLPQSTKETGNSHYKRRMNRTQQRLKAEAAAAAETDDDPTTSYVSDNFCCTGTQTELTGDAIEAMATKLQSLRTENIQLSSDVAHVSTSYDQSAFVDKDEKVLFFTGLPTYQILLVLFTFLSPHLPVRKSLDKFKQLMLTLMRLRLNVSTTFLSYAFNVSIATASRIVTDVIDVMFICMKPLIIWPYRDQLQKTMPMQFRKHFGKKCAVIIDCFEDFIERPSNLIARAETWSSYKHHNTVKFLIGITPQG
uniref:THAP-type domain-containing protein n=1 Tax=Cyprinus carpio carpio TaxID=630221 RepID=A0A9J8B0E7_CYPCA